MDYGIYNEYYDSLIYSKMKGIYLKVKKITKYEFSLWLSRAEIPQREYMVLLCPWINNVEEFYKESDK